MTKSIFVRSGTWRLFASIAGIALLVSCSPTPATEIVVRIDSDMVPGSELTSVALLVYRDGARDRPMVSHTYALDGRDYVLPGEVGLTPSSAGDARRIIVEVTADVRDGTDFSQRAITQFEAGRRLLLVMFLARRCQTTMCPAGRSCGADGTCVEDLRGSLPGFVPSDGAIDRVRPAEDTVVDVSVTDTDAPDAPDVVDEVAADVIDVSDVIDVADVPGDGSVCPPGFADCDRVATNGCETRLLAQANCGACGRACPGTTPRCAPADGGFECVATCATGLATCGSVCTTLASDALHCGDCGTVCAPGEGCVSGVCVCQAPYGVCAGVCRDLRSDLDHCGMCGHACRILEACTDGTCVAVRPTQISMHSSTIVRMSDGTVRGWGRNASGELGDGTTTSRARPIRLPFRDVARVYALPDAVCVVLNNQHAQCLGAPRSWGRFGFTSTTGIVALAAESDVICAVYSDGSVHCFGPAGDPGLGAGGTTTFGPGTSTPVTSGADQIASASGGICARMLTGRLRCWGSQRYAPLGDGTGTDRLFPVELALTDVADLASSSSDSALHRCARIESGGLRCWGTNGYGELGYNDTTTRYSPGPIIPGSNDFTQFATARGTACARSSGGTVSCWGVYGMTSSAVPTVVPGLTGVTSVTVGNATVGGENRGICAIRSGGEVVCWGGNTDGVLGDGTTVPHATPRSVVWE